MNPSNSISDGMIPECVTQSGVEKTDVAMNIQDQVERNDPRTAVPSRPVPGSAAPETPKLRSTLGIFEPVVTNEEEVV